MPGRRAKSLADTFEAAPGWLRMGGVYGWLFVGVAVLAVGAYYAYTWASAVAVPLIAAAVLGILFVPLVDRLEHHGVPRSLSAVIVLLLLLGIIVLVVWVTVSGVLSQGQMLVDQVSSGIRSLEEYVQSLDPIAVPGGELVGQGGLIGRISETLQSLASDGLTYVSTGVSSTLSALFGMFIGAFMLYFILEDWGRIKGWTAHHLGYPAELGEGIVSDAVNAMRSYFVSVTVTGLIVGAVVGAVMWILGLPLVFSVALITWLTCYIPYAGALISGAFAVFVALGSGGVVDALIMFAVVLFAQNVIQTIVQNQLAADSLDMHPLASLLATLTGGVVAGLLGTMLAPAMLASFLKSRQRVRRWKAHEELDIDNVGEAKTVLLTDSAESAGMPQGQP